jgi:N-acetylmuramoyl-L-alanine amidase
MKITTLILDRGHATLSENNKYITPGKQFKFPDGLRVYEGLENQKYVEALALYAKEKGFNIIYTVEPSNPADPSLAFRVKFANMHKEATNSLYLSIHNNAGAGQGTEVFTSIGKTKSDAFAQGIIDEIQKVFPNRRIRSDMKDGDEDKEENFYVLRHTSMPSVLMEYGFFDNRKDYEFLSDKDNITKLARATIDGIIKVNK